MIINSTSRKPKDLGIILFLISLNLFLFINNSRGSEEKRDKKELVTLDYKDAELGIVLKSLAQACEFNIVTPRDLNGKVNVLLKDVELDKALDAILTVNGYTFIKKDNITYVTSLGLLPDISLTTRCISLNYLSSSAAEKLLQKTISPKGDIRVNEQGNSLVITDYPNSLIKVEKILKEIDIPPLQVLIEAKIIDLDRGDYKSLGIDYSGTIKGGHGLFGKNSGIPERIGITKNMKESSGQIVIDTIELSNFSFNATLDALISKQKVHVLAAPSILTLSNKEARIVIGEKVPYKEKTQTTTGTTETTKFVDVGYALKVTPQVSLDGYITMFIHPEISTVKELLDSGPQIYTREADATVFVKDRETIVIGGLNKREKENTRDKIPLLGDIPIIGWFFSTISSKNAERELAVFITPTIINSVEDSRLSGLPSEEVRVELDEN
ncbi:MAG: secretin N-terminal domain-containing protein [bacterium]